MAILKSKDISKISKKEIEEKIKDLKIELIKNRISSGKGGKMKTREIKRTIARLLTFNRKQTFGKGCDPKITFSKKVKSKSKPLEMEKVDKKNY